MRRAAYRWLDRRAIKMGHDSVRRAGEWPAELDRARALLEQRPFLPEPEPPSSLILDRDGHFEFSSPMQTSWPVNDRVRGRFYTEGSDWRSRPCVVLLHGWQGELEYRWKYPWFARYLARRGLNTVAMILPFHGPRRPRGPGEVSCFLSSNLLATVDAFRQAVTDTRALVRWLIREGAPAVGLAGVSLGGWITGMTACVEPGLSCVAMTTPVVHLERAFAELEFCEPLRRHLREAAVDFGLMNLEEHRPCLDRDRILLIQSQHDLLAPAETIEALWQAWREPEIWRLSHGHISVLMSVPVMRRTLRWLTDKVTMACAD